ncbi:MAG TPA: hypothetical protein VEJ18_05605 [Planctomycetota bacterium]|nr:hypothetical protein [Planctomycetota bacterium]
MAPHILGDGSARLSDGGCTFTFERPRPGVLVVRIAGTDKGLLGTAPIDHVRQEIGRFGQLDLFIDARDAGVASLDVSDAWTAFFHANAGGLRRVSILAVSQFVHLTVSVAKLFSRTGELIQIYSDAALFEAALDAARRRA